MDEVFDSKSYLEGRRTALIGVLRWCADKLGRGDLRAEGAFAIAEREEAILELRKLCTEYGDNDWDDHIHLGEIIRKHLGNYLNGVPSARGNEALVPLPEKP